MRRRARGRRAAQIVDTDSTDTCWRSRYRLARALSIGPRYTPTLANRGIRDVFIVCCDGLIRLPEATEATRPGAIVQTWVTRSIRATMRFEAAAAAGRYRKFPSTRLHRYEHRGRPAKSGRVRELGLGREVPHTVATRQARQGVIHPVGTLECPADLRARGAPMFTARLSVGLDVHVRSAVAAAIVGVTGELIQSRFTLSRGQLRSSAKVE